MTDKEQQAQGGSYAYDYMSDRNAGIEKRGQK